MEDGTVVKQAGDQKAEVASPRFPRPCLAP